MSKAVLLSIQPKWCELIASGKKTVEVRKTRPKLETPFKVYIYCTNGKPILGRCLLDDSLKETPETDFDNYNRDTLFRANGKVIGEFVCKAILPISITYSDPNSRLALKEFPFTCLTDKEIMDYLGNGKEGYGWCISDLVIYDKPKELREFHNFCETYPCCDESCEYYSWTVEGGTECMCDTEKPFKRPPQSWCYVEELVGKD